MAKGLLLFRRQAEVEATSQSLGHVRNVDVLRRRLIGVDAARSVSPWRPNAVSIRRAVERPIPVVDTTRSRILVLSAFDAEVPHLKVSAK